MPTRLKILFALLCLFIIGGCATAPMPRGGGVVESNDLRTLCNRYNVDMDFDNVTQVIKLRYNGLEAKALAGSSVVVIGPTKITLSGPLRRRHNSIIVPPDFKRRVIDRLLEEHLVVAPKFHRIVVDAGHGGKDPGAIGYSGGKEKFIVLDIAERLRKNLQQHGVDVIMTRASDEFISLQERTEIASRAKADLFVSIHANSSHSHASRGMEIYYLRDLNWSEKKEDQIQRNKHTMLHALSMERNSPELNDILFDMFYNYKQEESRDIAHYVMNHAAHVVPAAGRGSKTAGFFVLKNTLIPAILVEVGFVTNPQEEKMLMSGSYRQEIADTLARSILTYAQK